MLFLVCFVLSHCSLEKCCLFIYQQANGIEKANDDCQSHRMPNLSRLTWCWTESKTCFIIVSQRLKKQPRVKHCIVTTLVKSNSQWMRSQIIYDWTCACYRHELVQCTHKENAYDGPSPLHLSGGLNELMASLLQRNFQESVRITEHGVQRCNNSFLCPVRHVIKLQKRMYLQQVPLIWSGHEGLHRLSL